MIAKSLIAAAAVATTMALVPTTAQAGTNIDIDLRFGAGGWYPGFYEPYYAPSHISCYKGKKILDYNLGYHSVSAVDCSLPGYKYTAKKNGHKWLVRMNGNGHVTGKSKIW